MSLVATNRLVDDHANHRVGFIEIGADRQDHIRALDLREGARGSRDTDGFLEPFGDTLVALAARIIEIRGAQGFGNLLDHEQFFVG